MKKALSLIFLLIFPSLVAAASTTTKEYKVKITPDMPYLDVDHNGQKVRIKRIQDQYHRLTDDFTKTSRHCPPFCIHPMKIAEGVETFGVLELLAFVKNKVNKGKGILIDARLPNWFKTETIPGSINTPFTLFKGKTIDTLIRLLGGKMVNGEWDFSQSLELALFCNGAWCEQSPMAIHGLLEKGYPAEKLKYYRGGMQDWKSFGLTTVVPKK